jgi:hypothetical protein
MTVEDMPIDADLVARHERGRYDWEIRDSKGVVGRVLRTGAGFLAMKAGPEGGYRRIGTFLTLATAGKALGRPTSVRSE